MVPYSSFNFNHGGKIVKMVPVTLLMQLFWNVLTSCSLDANKLTLIQNSNISKLHDRMLFIRTIIDEAHTSSKEKFMQQLDPWDI